VYVFEKMSDVQLAFSTSATNGFIGNLDEFALMNVLAAPSPGSVYIPELLYALFQSQFASVAIGILLGEVAERARIFPTIVFTFVWITLVYCPMVIQIVSSLTSGLLDLESHRMGL
jgi:Amt family ammonium transporter